MKIFIAIVVVIIFFLLIERILNKMLGIEREKISETPGKKVDRWGRLIILLIFLSTYWLVIDEGTNFIKGFWMLYLFLLLGFQALMEVIYLKDTKQYISTLIMLGLGMIALYNIDSFMQLFD